MTEGNRDTQTPGNSLVELDELFMQCRQRNKWGCTVVHLAITAILIPHSVLPVITLSASDRLHSLSLSLWILSIANWKINTEWSKMWSSCIRVERLWSQPCNIDEVNSEIKSRNFAPFLYFCVIKVKCFRSVAVCWHFPVAWSADTLQRGKH